MTGLAVIETHPVQYHAPVYRMLQQQFGIPVTAIYGSDFSVAGYRDREFGTSFAWDTDLLAGYTPVFLSRVANGGAASAEHVSARGIGLALQRVAPDAVLSVGYGRAFDVAAFLQAWRLGYPLLFRGETTDHALARTWARSLIRDATLRWLYGRCSKLLYVGQRSRRHFERLSCAEQKLVFAPYCVETSPFSCGEHDRVRLRPTARRELRLAPGDLALLFSGKLSPRKRPDLLLEAVKALPEAIRDRVVVVFLGSGQLRAALEEAARHSPAVATRFVGFQNQSQLSRYYHAADVLVLPSQHSETWGLVVNEALHHGLPCVVSDVTGCAPDLIRPALTGEVFAAGSASALSLALERAFRLVGDAAIRDACRQHVAGYTIEAAARGIAQAYASVVALGRQKVDRRV
jgi:glycosyltransferase involved in cell wall biosynthesis